MIQERHEKSGLLINIGNSNIAMAYSMRGNIEAPVYIRTNGADIDADFRQALDRYLKERGNKRDFSIKNGVIGSVVPSLTNRVAEIVRQICGVGPDIAAAANSPLVSIRQISHTEIGIDLVANATALYRRYGHAGIVVDFGTALTFTAVDRDGVLCGVAIAPGITTAIWALMHNTALLPTIEPDVPARYLGQDTKHAMEVGTVLGYEGLIAHVVAGMRTELGAEKEPVAVMATGGECTLIASRIAAIEEIDPLLTLHGLHEFL